MTNISTPEKYFKSKFFRFGLYYIRKSTIIYFVLNLNINETLNHGIVKIIYNYKLQL